MNTKTNAASPSGNAAVSKPPHPAWLCGQRTFFSGFLVLLIFTGLNFQQNVYAASNITGSELVAANALHFEPASFELWSKKRIQEHRDSLLQESEPPLGVLRIDRLNIEVPVYNGTDEFVLNRGVGRITGTARIDDVGNLGIAGHRDGFFRGLKDIQKGDLLHLQTMHGVTAYRVDAMIIVDPKEVSVLDPTTEQTLTLVTCYPFYIQGPAPKRFIVQATAQPQIAMNGKRMP